MSAVETRYTTIIRLFIGFYCCSVMCMSCFSGFSDLSLSSLLLYVICLLIYLSYKFSSFCVLPWSYPSLRLTFFFLPYSFEYLQAK